MLDLHEIELYTDIMGLHGLFEPDKLHKNYELIDERNQIRSKIIPSLEEAVRLSGLKDGMTISFHHHFRNGDYIVNLVLDTLARMGFKDLVVAASSLTDCHAPMIEHIQSGVVRRIETSGLRGKLAQAISNGVMNAPVVFRSHGGRAYAIETDELQIDVAFLGAPSSDAVGNANGYSRENNDKGIMCGAMGYAKCDATYANKTIILTDHIVPYPNAPFGIPESDVDFVVQVDAIGNAEGIMSGATRFTNNPKELLIAQLAADVIEMSGRFENGYSFQMGSGGASLAVAQFLREKMLRNNIKASFALGGITGRVVDLHEEGLVHKLLDVQSFDLIASQSLKNNRYHQQISASYYASPANSGTAVNQLDFTVLSALEVDCDFNVNVLTGSDGVIRGAIGGHPDTACGAAVSIVVVPLTRGRIPCVVQRVNTIVTPGKTVDVVVTEYGVGVNPQRKQLRENLAKAGIPLLTIEQLQQKAESLVGKPEPIRYLDKVVGIVAYRDNTIIDLIHQVQ